jgi:hypothetical protein
MIYVNERISIQLKEELEKRKRIESKNYIGIFPNPIKSRGFGT